MRFTRAWKKALLGKYRRSNRGKRYYSLALIKYEQDTEADYTRIRGVQFAVEGFVDWMNQSAISISWNEQNDVLAVHELNMKLQTPGVMFVVEVIFNFVQMSASEILLEFTCLKCVF